MTRSTRSRSHGISLTASFCKPDTNSPTVQSMETTRLAPSRSATSTRSAGSSRTSGAPRAALQTITPSCSSVNIEATSSENRSSVDQAASAPDGSRMPSGSVQLASPVSASAMRAEPKQRNCRASSQRTKLACSALSSESASAARRSVIASPSRAMTASMANTRSTSVSSEAWASLCTQSISMWISDSGRLCPPFSIGASPGRAAPFTPSSAGAIASRRPDSSRSTCSTGCTSRCTSCPACSNALRIEETSQARSLQASCSTVCEDCQPSRS